MVEERGGEEKKNWETDGLSEKGTVLRQRFWKTSFIVEICLQLFAGFSPHCCHIIFSSSLRFSVVVFFFFFPHKGNCVQKLNTFYI